MASQPPYQQPAPPYYGKPQPSSSSGIGVVVIVLIVMGVLLVGGVLICAVGTALLLPAVGAAREAARRTTSANNLKQIGLGLHNYHDTFKRLPYAVMADENGKPRHSWRTAILPFCEQVPVYDQIDFKRAWNESPNTALSAIPIPYMMSPLDTDSPPNHTSYLAISGPEAGFDPSRQLTLADMVDGTSNTIAVIEVPNSGVIWMEPRDISIDEAVQRIKSSTRPVNALMMDGSVQPISPDVPPDKLRAMMTRNGGEKLFDF